MTNTIDCPDCDCERIFGGGNGKCSDCHGTGLETNIFEALAESLSGQSQDCKSCDGSGECQTCYGKGYLDTSWHTSSGSHGINENTEKKRDTQEGGYSYEASGGYSESSPSTSSFGFGVFAFVIACIALGIGLIISLSNNSNDQSYLTSQGYYISASSGAALAGEFLFDSLRKPEYYKSWSTLIRGEKNAVTWLANYAQTKNGPASPSKVIKLGDDFYQLNKVCKAHDCGDNQFYVLFAPWGSKAWGVLLTDGTNEIFFGNPDDEKKSVLQAATKIYFILEKKMGSIEGQGYD